MTEAEWNSCTNPLAMLEFLWNGDRASERKLRLFAAACCRRIWQHFSTPGNRELVELLERVADDPTCAEAFRDAGSKAAEYAESDDGRSTEVGCSAAYAAASVIESYPGEHPAWIASRTADCSSNTRYWVAYEEVEAAGGDDRMGRAAGEAAVNCEEIVQADLLRDLLGPLPFREVTIAPAWPAWNGGAVEKLAQAAYQNPLLSEGHLDLDHLAVLADALEEAGCTDADLLAHLRSPGPHVRGCFALDLALGKS